MGKGSTRRVEDTEAIRRNWDAVFGPRIRVSPTPQTEREISPPLAAHICGIDACEERQ